MSSILRSSKFVRYFVGLARNIVLSTPREIDGALVQRSQCLANTVSNNYATVAAFNQNSALDKSIKRLDEDARKIGRISRKEIEEVLDEIRQSKKATSSQSLMVIRCCGNLVPEEAPELRTQLVKQVWNTLEKLGVPMDISHYNALLRVYLENEHRFSPTQFLAELEIKGVEPNRVTFQRLIAGFCQQGDIEGATRILEFMRERQLPVSENVFNALVLGHSQADDMESAHGILGVMKQAGLQPSNETYTTLMCGYAKKGDITAIEKLIEESETKELFLSDKDILEVVYTLGVNKHSDLVDKILPKVKYMLGYNQDSANVILRLINKGDDETAMKIFKTMKIPAGLNGQPVYAGSFIIRQMVKCNKPAEKIIDFCKQLRQEGLNSLSFTIAVHATFTVNNLNQTLELLRALFENNEPVRIHYLWPLLVAVGKAGDVTGVKTIITTMVRDLNIQPTSETLRDYVLPYMKEQKPENILAIFVEAGMKRGTSAAAIIGYLVSKNKLKEAVTLALQNVDINFLQAFGIRTLVNAYETTQDLESFVTLVRALMSSVNKERSVSQSVEEEEGGGEEMENIGLMQEEIVGKCLMQLAIKKSRNMVKVLEAFLDHGLAISNSSAQLIENSLGGENLTEEVSTLLAKLASGEIASEPLKRQMVKSSISRSPVALEGLKEKLIANGGSIDGVLRQLLTLYSFNKDMDSALKIKNDMEARKIEISPAHYAQIMDGYLNLEQLDKAEEIYNEAKANDSGFRLDRVKAIKLANLLVQNDKIDEAIDVIKFNTFTGSNDVNYSLNSLCWRMLNSLAEKKNVQNVKKMLDALSENNYIDISNIFLGSIIKAHLLNNDLEGALDEFERCCEIHRATPWKNELMCKLIQAEDANNLQRLTDLSTQIHGEVNSLYDLVLAFVECGRVRQARKILETPGLRSREDRINIASQRFQNDGLVVPLENLIEVTKDLGHIDRTSLYYQLLLSYKNTKNVDKALGLWTKMQEEDVPLTDEFLLTLGNFLKANGREVPFVIPTTTKLSTDVDGSLDNQTKARSKNKNAFLKALQDNQVDKALEVKGIMEASGEELNRTDRSRLLEALLKEDRINEANRLVMSWLPGKPPAIPVLKFFTNRLASTGDIEAFDQFGSRINELTQKTLSFENKRINCLLAAGKGLEELERWEKAIDSAKTQEEIDTVALKFPHGGILGLLEKHPECIPEYEKLVDKFKDKGFVGPANSLFNYYLSNSEVDKAKAVFDKYLRNSSRLMYKSVLTKARSSRNPELVLQLKEIIKDYPSVTPGMLGHLYGNIINIYCFDNKFDDALAQLEEGIKACGIENIATTTLNRLKTGLEANNQTFKYTIPAKSSGKSESSSSSSSDDEKKSTQRQ